jgi:hypothetical protein
LPVVAIRAPWPSDKSRPVKILAAGELDSTPKTPAVLSPLPGSRSGLTRRRPPLPGCAPRGLAFYRVAVTTFGRPIIAGEVATPLATNSRGQCFLLPLRPPRGSAKLSTTARGRYKLTVPPAPPCIQAAIAPACIPNLPPENLNSEFPPTSLSATVKQVSPWPAQIRSVHVALLLVLTFSCVLDAFQTIQLNLTAMN